MFQVFVDVVVVIVVDNMVIVFVVIDDEVFIDMVIVVDMEQVVGWLVDQLGYHTVVDYELVP